MRTLTWRFPRWTARFALFLYCGLIFIISSFSRPEEELGLPTGAIPHFLEYGGLGVLAWLNLFVQKSRSCPRRWLAMAFCALYAVTDELHQFYVPFRSCELKDWMIDVLGSGTGIAVVEYLLARKIIRIRG